MKIKIAACDKSAETNDCKGKSERNKCIHLRYNRVRNKYLGIASNKKSWIKFNTASDGEKRRAESDFSFFTPADRCTRD